MSTGNNVELGLKDPSFIVYTGRYFPIIDKDVLIENTNLKSQAFSRAQVNARGSAYSASYGIEVQINCDQSGTVPATQGNTLTYTVRSTPLGKVRDVRHKIEIIETGGSNTITPTVATHMFQSVQTQVGNDGNITQLQYDDTMYKEILSLGYEKFTTLCLFNNLQMTASTAAASGTSIAASGTADYEVPILGNIATSFNLNWIRTNQMIKYTFFAPTSGILASGTGVAAYNAGNCKLLFHTRKFSDEYWVLTEQETASTLLVNYHTWQLFEVTLTLNYATAIDNILTTIKGLMIGAFFVLRSAILNTSNGRITYALLGGGSGTGSTAEIAGLIQFKNSAGVNALSQNGVLPKEVRSVLHALHFHDVNSGNAAMYDIGLSNDPYQYLLNGNPDGAYVMTNQENCNITSATSAQSGLTGSYVFSFYACMGAGMFVSENGTKVTSTK
jgi:hypothetical protein